MNIQAQNLKKSIQSIEYL